MPPVSLKDMVKIVKQGGRLVGLDVGTVQVGIAVSNPKCLIASPHGVMHRMRPVEQNLLEMEDIVRNYSVVGMVVGYPLQLHGTQSCMGPVIKKFMEEDMARSSLIRNLPYVLWDERYSSVAAAGMLSGLKLKKKDEKRMLDKISAVYILQGCLDAIAQQQNAPR